MRAFRGFWAVAFVFCVMFLVRASSAVLTDDAHRMVAGCMIPVWLGVPILWCDRDGCR